MNISAFLAMPACILLAACVTEDGRLQQASTTSQCGRVEAIWGSTSYELPPEDLGNSNVGLYTLVSVGEGPEYGRYSMLNCKTAQITRVEQTDGPGDLRKRIDALRKTGALTTPANLAAAAQSVPGLAVIEGKVRREEGTRASCACFQHYPEDWVSGYPPNPDGSRPVYVPPAALRVSD